MLSQYLVDSVMIDEFTDFLTKFINRDNITAEQESLARLALSNVSFLGALILSFNPIECSHAYFDGVCTICLSKEVDNADINSA